MEILLGKRLARARSCIAAKVYKSLWKKSSDNKMEKQITAWHYAPFRLLCSVGDIEINGLIPLSRVDMAGEQSLPEMARKRWIYAFLERTPESWRGNIEFPDIWTRVMRHVSHGKPMFSRCSFDILLEDEAFVVDFAHMERVREVMIRLGYAKIKKGTFSDADKAKLIEANTRYLSSAIEVFSYQGGYTLPEVIVGNPIPRARIRALEMCSSA